MVRDNHIKVLHYMEQVHPADCCSGFDSESKACGCHDKLISGKLGPNDANTFFSSMSANLWCDVVKVSNE